VTSSSRVFHVGSSIPIISSSNLKLYKSHAALDMSNTPRPETTWIRRAAPPADDHTVLPSSNATRQPTQRILSYANAVTSTPGRQATPAFSQEPTPTPRPDAALDWKAIVIQLAHTIASMNLHPTVTIIAKLVPSLLGGDFLSLITTLPSLLASDHTYQYAR
jgi:hypothetical protein